MINIQFFSGPCKTTVKVHQNVAYTAHVRRYCDANCKVGKLYEETFPKWKNKIVDLVNDVIHKLGIS